MSRRFQGGQSSERLAVTTVKSNDYIQVYHDAGGAQDSDKGLPFCVAQAQPVASCATASGTVAKVATVIAAVSQPDFALINGRIVTVKMTNANTATDPTLNVNSTGAFPIRLVNQASSVHVGSGCWGAGVFLQFQYVNDGSNQYWLLLGHNVANATSEYTTYADGRIEYSPDVEVKEYSYTFIEADRNALATPFTYFHSLSIAQDITDNYKPLIVDGVNAVGIPITCTLSTNKNAINMLSNELRQVTLRVLFVKL